MLPYPENQILFELDQFKVLLLLQTLVWIIDSFVSFRASRIVYMMCVQMICSVI